MREREGVVAGRCRSPILSQRQGLIQWAHFPGSTGETMASSDSIGLPRLKIVHVMIITLVLAIVFYALTSQPTDSVASSHP